MRDEGLIYMDVLKGLVLEAAMHVPARASFDMVWNS